MRQSDIVSIRLNDFQVKKNISILFSKKKNKGHAWLFKTSFHFKFISHVGYYIPNRLFISKLGDWSQPFID